jgi:hypothetical protein
MWVNFSGKFFREIFLGSQQGIFSDSLYHLPKIIVGAQCLRPRTVLNGLWRKHCAPTLAQINLASVI